MCSWRGVDHKDQPGRHPVKGGVTVLHVAPGQDANTLRHELGHCLGLWHEFGRPDRDFWLDEQPKDVDGTVDWKTTYGTADCMGSSNTITTTTETCNTVGSDYYARMVSCTPKAGNVTTGTGSSSSAAGVGSLWAAVSLAAVLATAIA